jgi:hypothetical protein
VVEGIIASLEVVQVDSVVLGIRLRAVRVDRVIVRVISREPLTLLPLKRLEGVRRLPILSDNPIMPIRTNVDTVVGPTSLAARIMTDARARDLHTILITGVQHVRLLIPPLFIRPSCCPMNRMSTILSHLRLRPLSHLLIDPLPSCIPRRVLPLLQLLDLCCCCPRVSLR